METQRSLVKKLATIMSTLGPLQRTGEKRGQTRAGGEFSYDVFLEGDILQPCQRALAAHGIIVIPRCVALDRNDLPGKPGDVPKSLVTAMVEFTIADSDSDERLVGQMPGSAEERGDGTGVSKALTDSNKNFLRKLFELSAAEEETQRRTPRPPAPTPKPTTRVENRDSEPELITEPQRRRLFGLCKQYRLDADVLKDHLFKEFGFSSSRDVTRERYESICKWIEAHA